MREIREIYQRWLEGDLSQEDALFAIGDLLDEEAGEGAASDRAATGREGHRPAAGQKGA
jgi:hypothetical protein